MGTIRPAHPCAATCRMSLCAMWVIAEGLLLAVVSVFGMPVKQS
jgi:hypothetical protein